MDEFVKYILYFAVGVMAVSMITLYIYGIRKLLEMRNLKRRCICSDRKKRQKDLFSCIQVLVRRK